MSQPPTVLLVGAQPSCAKVDAVKEVRRVAGWGLKEAKEAVDASLGGEPRTVPLLPGVDPGDVAARLADLGFVAEAGGRRYERPAGEPYAARWEADLVGSIQVIRAGASVGETLRLDARLVSGRVLPGDRVGLPLNSSLLMTASVERVVQSEGSVTVTLADDPEETDLWNEMLHEGEVLPVLPPASSDPPAPPRNRRWRRWLAALLGAALLLGGVWRLHKSRSVQLWGGLVTRVETDRPVVALTLDDGPSAHGTGAVLDTLARLGVRATFFVTGHELEAKPDLGRRIAEAGHALGNHSYSHAPMVLRSPAWVRTEVERTDSLIRAAGYDGPIPFRPPYGKRLVVLPRYLHQTGRETLFWDVEPESYPEVAASAERIADHVVARVRPGSIVLLHVMYPAREESLRAVPIVVRRLRAAGYRFVTVPELLALRPEARQSPVTPSATSNGAVATPTASVPSR